MGEEQTGRYIIADVLFLRLCTEFTGVHFVIELYNYEAVFVL